MQRSREEEEESDSEEPKLKKQKTNHQTDSEQENISQIATRFEYPEFEYSPLHFACQENRIEEVKRLLEERSVNLEEIEDACCEESMETPLSLAAENGNMEIVKLLVFHNAKSFHEAMCAACVKGHIDIVKFLSEQYAKHDMLRCWREPDETVIWHAVEGGSLDIVRYIIDEDLCQEPDTIWLQLIELAVDKDFDDIARYLSSTKLNGEIEVEQSLRSLCLALAKGKHEIAEEIHCCVNSIEVPRSYDTMLGHVACSALEGKSKNKEQYVKQYRELELDNQDYLCAAAENGYLDLYQEEMQYHMSGEHSLDDDELNDENFEAVVNGNIDILQYNYQKLRMYEPLFMNYFRICTQFSPGTDSFEKLYEWMKSKHLERSKCYDEEDIADSYFIQFESPMSESACRDEQLSALLSAVAHDRIDLVKMLCFRFDVPIFDQLDVAPCFEWDLLRGIRLHFEPLVSFKPIEGSREPHIIQLALTKNAHAVLQFCQKLMRERLALVTNSHYRDVQIQFKC